jgi:hypothetical protein
MAKICHLCSKVHSGKCPKGPTRKQMQKKISEFVKKVEVAHKNTKNSKLIFGES